MLKLIKALSVMTCALLLHTNAQASYLIDDFSTDQAAVTDDMIDGVGSSDQIFSAGEDIIGGYRDIYVEEVANGIGGDDETLGIHVQVSSGRFSATLDDLVKAFAVLTYDGANEVGNDWETGVMTDGLGGEDWSGTVGFLFEEVSNDLVAPAQLIVWTDDNMDGITYTKHLLDFETFGNINAGGLYDALIPVSWFDDYENINWSSVGAFQAIFNLDSTQDLTNSEISVDLSLARATAVTEIPEPAALSTFGAGVLMLGFMGYRHRRNQ